MSVGEIVGIGHVTKPVRGAVLVEIKIGEDTLLLKCLVIEDMRYDMVLGRDMLNIWLENLEYSRSRAIFRKKVPKEDIINEGKGMSSCYVRVDILLEPNRVQEVEFDTEFEEVHGGTLVGNKDLEKKGVYILKNRVQGNNRSCWVYNTSKTPIMLKRQAIIAQVNEPDKKVVAVWSVKGNTEVPSVAQQNMILPSEATEMPSAAPL